MSDVYDRAVDYLSKNPGKIFDAWSVRLSSFGGCLFLYATRSGVQESIYIPGIDRPEEGATGCLTQIRLSEYKMAATKKLSNQIRNDSRIPLGPDDIRISDLPTFAEWQRIIDAELGRRVEELDSGSNVYIVRADQAHNDTPNLR